jgi:hypothetical protein
VKTEQQPIEVMKFSAYENYVRYCHNQQAKIERTTHPILLFINNILHFETMMAAVPDGASCYICLDEGPDEEGKPLVRDCSCRGDTAGFAHLSCIVEYAEQKCKQVVDSDLTAFSTPWAKCNNCHQPFQNQVALDLSSAFVSLAEKAYNFLGNGKWDKVKVLSSLRCKIHLLLNLVCSDSPREDKGTLKVECEMLIKKLLSMVDQTKKDLKMSSWLHMPPTSDEYQYYKALCGTYEALGYQYLGEKTLMDHTEASYKRSITYYQKARAICNLFGFRDRAKLMDVDIAALKECLARCDGDGANVTVNASTLLQGAKYNYEYYLKTFGLNSEITLQSGLILVTELVQAHRGIEAERLSVKLAASSRRVHGPGHNCSMSLDEQVKECKSRYVIVMPDDKLFQALRYENDGEICVVTGPVKQPRQEDDERIFHVANNLIIPTKGCPVICHGLVSASHLNGELGEVRALSNNITGFQLGVHFEKTNLKPALVKPENLRISFELPSKE